MIDQGQFLSQLVDALRRTEIGVFAGQPHSPIRVLIKKFIQPRRREGREGGSPGWMGFTLAFSLFLRALRAFAFKKTFNGQ